MARTKLDDNAIAEAMNALPDWTRADNHISRSYQFENFIEAFGWMTKAAFAAEKLDHHPDWKNVYNRVEVSLSTHDAGGLTESDFELAKTMDDLY